MFAGAMLTACNNKPAVDMAKEQQSLMAADQAFCSTEMQQGMRKAMEKFYDDEVVGISPNSPVSVGKAAILKEISDMKMDSSNGLRWKAEKCVVSASGDLGYCWGRYDYKGKNKEGVDTTWYGAYCTVYKKEADGSWKAVVDQNNDTPKP